MRRRPIAIAFGVAALLAALGVALGPGIVAGTVERRLSAQLGTPVRLGWLTWNPFTGRWTLHGLRIAAERGPAAFSVRRAGGLIHLWDLVRGEYRVRTLALDRARVRLRATPEGWELPLPVPPPDAGGGTGLRLALDWVGAPRALVRLEPRPGVRSLLRMRQLEVTAALTPESTRATIWTRGRLDRGSVAFLGRVQNTTGSRRIRLRMVAARLDLARTLRLAGDSPVGDVRGRVDVRAKYDEAGRADSLRRSVTGSASARDLALRAPGVDGLWLKDLKLERFALDLERRALVLGPVAVRGAEVWVRRSGSRLTIPGLIGENTGPSPAAWSIAVGRTDLTDGVVHELDADGDAPGVDVALDELHLGAIAGLDQAVPFAFAAGLASGGRVAARGEVVRAPLTVTAHTELTGVVLAPLVEAAGLPLRLESGEVSGTLEVGVRDGVVDGSGTVTVAGLKTFSPEPTRPEDLLAFKELRVAVRRARSDPPSLALESVELDWPYVLVDRTPDGIFPFSLVAGAAAPSERERTPASVRIERLHVLGGRIDFRDTTLEPPYWRALASLDLQAERIDAPDIRIAAVRAKGLVDEWSPLQVEGTVGTRTHLVAEVERLALPPFNAYLEGASPYQVSSGALSGRSEITLDRSQLEVDNHVVLSRLGLSGGRDGDFVKRELGIPLTLALALMKDYRGNIELALPFGGDLKERSFELRSVVMQAIVRAVRGAILAPLNALGRVFLRDGRIERVELDAIPFPPGGRDLDAAGRERTAQVAHVLQSHPELAARLRGTVAAADLERLQDEATLSALVDDPGAEPLRAFVRARLEGRPPPSLTEAEVARLDAVRAGLPWSADALRDLAIDRGAVAAATLILDHRIDPARVSADLPETPTPDHLAAAPGAAVEISER